MTGKNPGEGVGLRPLDVILWWALIPTSDNGLCCLALLDDVIDVFMRCPAFAAYGCHLYGPVALPQRFREC